MRRNVAILGGIALPLILGACIKKHQPSPNSQEVEKKESPEFTAKITREKSNDALNLMLGDGSWTPCIVTDTACDISLGALFVKHNNVRTKLQNDIVPKCNGNPDCISTVESLSHAVLTSLGYLQGDHQTYRDKAVALLTDIVEKANALNLGVFNLNPLILNEAKEFQVAPISFNDAMELAAIRANQGAQTMIIARNAGNLSVFNAVREGAGLLTGLVSAVEGYIAGPFGAFRTCGTITLSSIAALSAAHMEFQLNNRGGGPGNGGPGGGGGNPPMALTGGSYATDSLRSHFTYQTDHFTVDLSNSERVDSNGKVARAFNLGYRVSDHLVWPNGYVSPITGNQLLIPGTVLAVVENLTPDYPTYEVVGNKLRSISRGTSLHYRDLDLPDFYVDCNDVDGSDDLLAGEAQLCPLNLDVTGSPTEIAAGSMSTKEYMVYQMGGNDHSAEGDQYFKRKITLTAPMERPSDPCFEWNPITSEWECHTGPQF